MAIVDKSIISVTVCIIEGHLDYQKLYTADGDVTSNGTFPLYADRM